MERQSQCLATNMDWLIRVFFSLKVRAEWHYNEFSNFFFYSVFLQISLHDVNPMHCNFCHHFWPGEGLGRHVLPTWPIHAPTIPYLIRSKLCSLFTSRLKIQTFKVTVKQQSALVVWRISKWNNGQWRSNKKDLNQTLEIWLDCVAHQV